MNQQDGCNFSDKISLEANKCIKDGVCLESNMLIELIDSKGNIKDVRRIHNAITDAARFGIMDQVLAAPSLNKPGWIELGTGSPAATLLGAYIAGSRVAMTTKTRLNNVVTFVGDWPAGTGTGAITEAGVFDVVTANTVNMWCSASFAVLNKGASDVLKITWTLTGS